MLFSGKENIFKCLVAFQKMFWKIFSGVWLCSWKYHRKYIFYLLLTFSHIFSIAKQIYNIIPQYRNTKETKPRKNIHQIWSIQKYKRNKTQKKFIKSGQYKNTKETKPRKKIHQIQSNWEKKEEREATWFDLEARSRGGCEGEIARQRRDRVVLESMRSVRLAQCCDRRDQWSVGHRTGARSEDWALSYSSLSLFLSLCLFLRKSPEMVWSENFHFKPFPSQTH